MSELKVIDVYDVYIDTDLNDNNDDCLLGSSEISVEFSNGDKIDVQLSSGEYKASLGCIARLNRDQENDMIDDEMLSTAVHEAEQFIRDKMKDYQDEIIDDAKCRNQATVILRVNKKTGETLIIDILDYLADYEVEEKLIIKFDSKKEALEFLEDNRDENDNIDLYDIMREMNS